MNLKWLGLGSLIAYTTYVTIYAIVITKKYDIWYSLAQESLDILEKIKTDFQFAEIVSQYEKE